MADECLRKQTFQDFEWLVGMPEDKAASLRFTDDQVTVYHDPPRQAGDFYCLNKSWNNLCAQAKGDLLVFLCDWIWFDQYALERFWGTYEEMPLACVSSFGHHYRKVINGKPTVLWEWDRRHDLLERKHKTDPEWDGYTMPAHLMELALASIPTAKFREVGGFDPMYDQWAGCSEQELAYRLEHAGCSFVLAPGIEVRNYTHPKESTTKEWDVAYAKASNALNNHIPAIKAGTRSLV